MTDFRLAIEAEKSKGKRGARVMAPLFIGPMPEYLKGRPHRPINQDMAGGLSIESPEEIDKVMHALKHVRGDTYEGWRNVGFALNDTGWECAWDIFDAWSKAYRGYDEGNNRKLWESFGRGNADRITVGWLFMTARANGWDERAWQARYNARVVPNPEAPPERELRWERVGKNGPLTTSPANVYLALNALGFECRLDTFHDKIILRGRGFDGSDLSDGLVMRLLRLIYETYGVEFGKEAAYGGIMQLAQTNKFHPIRDYLDGLRWDGVPRLDTWLTDCMGVEDTELHRAFGRIALIAAVRRVRDPGCKFDQMIVLEGAEELYKSTAIAILAGADNFSDQAILALSEQRQQEAVQGVWFYECAELSGIKRAEFEHVKSFMSRQWDRCRPAYERKRIDMPRQCVFWGTSNDEHYLQFEEGIRRFWPVAITREIDIGRLRADRDQLFAEANEREAKGESIVLERSLRKAARQAQEARIAEDPWEVFLAGVKGIQVGDEVRVHTTDLFSAVNVELQNRHAGAGKRIARIMRKLGWVNNNKVIRIKDKVGSGYSRPVVKG